MATANKTWKRVSEFLNKSWLSCKQGVTRIVRSPTTKRDNRIRCLFEYVGVGAASLLFCLLLTVLVRLLLNTDKLSIPFGILDFAPGVFAFWSVFAFVWIAASFTYHFAIRNTLAAAPEANFSRRLAWAGVSLLSLLGLKLAQELVFLLVGQVRQWPIWNSSANLLTPAAWIVAGEIVVILITVLAKRLADRRSFHIRLLGVSAPVVIGSGWAAFVLSSMCIYPRLVTSAYQDLEVAYLKATPIQSVLASDIFFDSPDITIAPGPRSPEVLRVRSATQEESLLGRRILRPLFERLSVIPQGIPLEDLPSEEAYVEMVDWFLKNIIEDEAIRALMDGAPRPDENGDAQLAFQKEELSLARYLTSPNRTIPGFSTEMLLAYSGALPAQRAAAYPSEENPGELTPSVEDTENMDPATVEDDSEGHDESTVAEQQTQNMSQSEREIMALWIASRLAGTQPRSAYPFSGSEDDSKAGDGEEVDPREEMSENSRKRTSALLPWDIIGTPSQPDDVETVRALLRWEGPIVEPRVDLANVAGNPPIDWEREERFQSSFRSLVTELISASHSDPSVQASRFGVALVQGAEQLAMLVLTVWSLLILAARWIVVFRRSNTLNKLLDGENGSREVAAADTSEEQTGESEEARQFLKLVLTGKLSAGDFGTKRRNKNVLDRKERREGIDLAERKTRSSRWLLSWLTTALPAIGFIGTVRGISAGLENADAIVRAGSSIEQAAAINLVAGQLGVAFTTTLIALVLGLLVTFFERMQNAVEVRFMNRLRDVVQQPEGV